MNASYVSSHYNIDFDRYYNVNEKISRKISHIQRAQFENTFISNSYRRPQILTICQYFHFPEI